MARSTKLMIPGTAFCLVGLVSQGLSLYVSAAIGVAFVVIGGIFWMCDGF